MSRGRGSVWAGRWWASALLLRRSCCCWVEGVRWRGPASSRTFGCAAWARPCRYTWTFRRPQPAHRRGAASPEKSVREPGTEASRAGPLPLKLRPLHPPVSVSVTVRRLVLDMFEGCGLSVLRHRATYIHTWLQERLKHPANPEDEPRAPPASPPLGAWVRIIKKGFILYSNMNKYEYS